MRGGRKNKKNCRIFRQQQQHSPPPSRRPLLPATTLSHVYSLYIHTHTYVRWVCITILYIFYTPKVSNRGFLSLLLESAAAGGCHHFVVVVSLSHQQLKKETSEEEGEELLLLLLESWGVNKKRHPIYILLVWLERNNKSRRQGFFLSILDAYKPIVSHGI